MNYVLDNQGNPIAEPDVLAWAMWFQENNSRRQVARDELPSGTVVSTVFLGINHNFGPGAPLLFETMVFGGRFDEEQERYATREQAIAGHDQILARVTESERD
jgi:hypothetical protein